MGPDQSLPCAALDYRSIRSKAREIRDLCRRERFRARSLIEELNPAQVQLLLHHTLGYDHERSSRHFQVTSSVPIQPTIESRRIEMPTPESHGSANQQTINNLQQIFNHFDFVRDFRSSNQRQAGPLGMGCHPGVPRPA